MFSDKEKRHLDAISRFNQGTLPGAAFFATKKFSEAVVKIGILPLRTFLKHVSQSERNSSIHNHTWPFVADYPRTFSQEGHEKENLVLLFLLHNSIAFYRRSKKLETDVSANFIRLITNQLIGQGINGNREGLVQSLKLLKDTAEKEKDFFQELGGGLDKNYNKLVSHVSTIVDTALKVLTPGLPAPQVAKAPNKNRQEEKKAIDANSFNDVNNLPFKTTVFFKDSASEGRFVHECELLDTCGIVTPEMAKSLINQLGGLQDIKAQLEAFTDTKNTTLLFRRALQATIQRQTGPGTLLATPSRSNIIIQGPNGVGKTTLARAIGIYLIVHGMAPGSKIALAKALNLRGHYTGRTDKVVDAYMGIAKSGVAIVDEADGISTLGGSTSFDREARNALNAGMESANKGGTIFIFTGLPQGIECLLNDQPGFPGRFPTIFKIPHFEENTIGTVLRTKIDLEGLKIDPQAETLALEQLCLALRAQKSRFTNGRAIDEFVGMMVNTHAAQFPNSLHEAILRGDQTPPTNYDVIFPIAVPMFDHREFKIKGAAQRDERKPNIRLVDISP